MNRIPKQDNTKLYYANPKSREVLQQKVRQVFNLFDTDGSGEIDAKEFHDLVYSMGKIMTDEEVAKYLAVLDRDCNGSVSFDEFFDWWCTRDDSNSNDHSADKLKEVKAKLQSRSLMRSISFLINKAKNDLEAQKSQNNSNNNATEKSSTGADPNSLVIDAKIKIGNLESNAAKAAFRLSFMEMETPANIYRMEFRLTDGATDQDAEQIKQVFVTFNTMAMGMLFQNISLTTATHGNARHASVELHMNNAGPAEAVLRNANLKKLLISFEASQRLEELDLKTLQLNFGIHFEASKLILGMLPPASDFGPFFSGMLSMMQRMVFELHFDTIHEAVAYALERDLQRFQGENLNTTKRQTAKLIREKMTSVGINPNLPIAELTQVMIQVGHNAFLLDQSGFDLSYMFTEDTAANVKAPQITAPQTAPTEATLNDTKVIAHEPQVPIPAVTPATSNFISQFADVVELPEETDEATKAFLETIALGIKNFSAKKVDARTGKEFPVTIEAFIPTNLNQYQHIWDIWQKIAGYPHVIEYLEVKQEGEWVYLASTDYAGLGYRNAAEYLAEIAQKGVRAEYEPIAKTVLQKMLNAAMIFSKSYVTHSIAAEFFLIHPQTLDCRIQIMTNLRPYPVLAVPEEVLVPYMPPELFYIETASNYGPEVDVWMFGMVCYTVLTNRLAYEVLPTGEGMEKVVTGDWDRTGEHFTALPEKARNFIARILVVDKNARPTFSELSTDEFFTN